MTAIVFYFQVHQPYRLRRYKFFDIGRERGYFDDTENARILRRVAERCYLPVNRILAEAIEKTDGRFRCAFSISGTALRQFEQWCPAALDSFAALADTGSVEFLCETAGHSLASQADAGEFRAQLDDHKSRIRDLCGREPTTVRNTELIFDNGIAKRLEDMGFEVLLGEGADRLLGSRSPRQVYRPKGCRRMKLLLRDYELSDDIAFRFSNRKWPGYPLMADTFSRHVHEADESDAFIGLFMDYETFGEHQGEETGILDFLAHLPDYLLDDERFEFRTPAELAALEEAVEELDAPQPISWADAERDVSAWLGNPMQRAAHEALYELGPNVQRAAKKGHPELLEIWRRLTTSDHVYYMCTKQRSDGDVHEYFSPHESPHEAFITFMNVLDDLTRRVQRALADEKRSEVKR